MEHADDLLPVLAVEGLLTREDDHALVVFEAFEQHVDLVAHVNVVEVVELAVGDDPLGLVADVDEDFARANFEDVAFDDGTLTEILHGFVDEVLHGGHGRRGHFGVGETS